MRTTAERTTAATASTAGESPLEQIRRQAGGVVESTATTKSPEFPSSPEADATLSPLDQIRRQAHADPADAATPTIFEQIRAQALAGVVRGPAEGDVEVTD